MKSRLTHLALMVLGAAGVVLALLAQIPKYAGAAGALALLVADARKALAPVDIAKPAAGVFALLLIGHALFGCAHIASVTQTCEATTAQAEKILQMLGSSSVASVAVAAVDALGFGCATANEINSYIMVHEVDGGQALMKESDPLDALRLANAYAWRAAHK